jgi:hypothetical protein
VSAKLPPRGGRPFSAQTRQSVISSRKQIAYIDKVDGVVKKGRGLGFFGDDNDRVRNFKEGKDTEMKQKVREITLVTDAHGRVNIPGVPVGLYTVEVAGSSEFQPSTRDVNIVNDEDKDEIVVYIAMKPKVSSSIEFNILSSAATG